MSFRTRFHPTSTRAAPRGLIRAVPWLVAALVFAVATVASAQSAPPPAKTGQVDKDTQAPAPDARADKQGDKDKAAGKQDSRRPPRDKARDGAKDPERELEEEEDIS